MSIESMNRAFNSMIDQFSGMCDPPATMEDRKQQAQYQIERIRGYEEEYILEFVNTSNDEVVHSERFSKKDAENNDVLFDFTRSKTKEFQNKGISVMPRFKGKKPTWS